MTEEERGMFEKFFYWTKEEVETYNLAIDHSIKIIGNYMTANRMEPGERTLLNIVSEAIYKLKKP